MKTQHGYRSLTRRYNQVIVVHFTLCVTLFVCSFICLLSEFIVLVHSHLNVRVCASGVEVEATCQIHRVVHEPTLLTVVVVVCWLVVVCLLFVYFQVEISSSTYNYTSFQLKQESRSTKAFKNRL